MSSAERPVVLLTREGVSSRVVLAALRDAVGEVTVVAEAGQSGAEMARRRLRKLGPWTVAGQVAFSLAIRPLLARRGRRRAAEILARHDLREEPFPNGTIRVPSVNSPEAREVLRRLRPAVVVVNGTRIIGKETLACIDCPILNMHMGITPAYRGVHGGYWALVDGRPELAGSTVHLVDAGIDTGSVVSQGYIEPTSEDSFYTYPFLQLAVGVPLLVQAVKDALAGRLSTRPHDPALPSRLRTHPTLWGYLATRLRRGIR